MLAPIAWRTSPRAYGSCELVTSELTGALVARDIDITLFATLDSQTAGKLDGVVPASSARESDACEALASGAGTRRALSDRMQRSAGRRGYGFTRSMREVGQSGEPCCLRLMFTKWRVHPDLQGPLSTVFAESGPAEIGPIVLKNSACAVPPRRELRKVEDRPILARIVALSGAFNSQAWNFIPRLAAFDRRNGWLWTFSTE